VSRIRKKTFYLQFCMGTLEGNEFAGWIQNPKKIIGTSNQPIKTKIFPKKVCLVPQKCKGPANSYVGYPTEFAGSTQKPKKISQHQINQSKRNFSQNKYV
jgi:hypothetical protein